MRLLKNSEKEVNKRNLNEVIDLTKKILKILFFFLIIAGVYAITLILKEWRIKYYLLTILSILAPLFIGILVAWLFDPFVKWLKKKGIKRTWGAIITYVLLLGGIFIVLSAIVPMLSDQINEFAKTIPSVFETFKDWIDSFFNNLKIENFDSEAMKLEIFARIEAIGVDLTNNLPEITVNVLKSFFSGMGTILVGLIIGFYLLVSFENVNDTLVTFLPKKLHKDARDLTNEVNTSLRRFVQGALLDSTVIFVITSIGLYFAGLKAPLLFGLFCGLTNVIPYAGPYIGGAPAVIVGFAQSPTVGIFTLIVIAVIQFVEGNFFQPLIMSKTTKLHPVTIISGLLLFGHFWGIIGMLVSTPIIAACKSIFLFFDEKYDFFQLNND